MRATLGRAAVPLSGEAIPRELLRTFVSVTPPIVTVPPLVKRYKFFTLVLLIWACGAGLGVQVNTGEQFSEHVHVQFSSRSVHLFLADR